MTDTGPDNDRLLRELARNSGGSSSTSRRGSSGSRPRERPADIDLPPVSSETLGTPELNALAGQFGIPIGPVVDAPSQYSNLPISDDFATNPVVRPAPVNLNNPGFVGIGRTPNFVEAGGPEQHITNVGDWMNEFTTFGQTRIRQYQDMMERAGLLSEGGYIPGIPDRATLSALGTVLGAASNSGLSAESVLGIAVDNQQTLGARRGRGGGGRPTTITLSNRNDLESLLDNAAQQMAGRNLESLGIDPGEFADAVQAAERDLQARALAGGEIEQIESASSRAQRFLEERAAPALEARQVAAAFTAIENLIGRG